MVKIIETNLSMNGNKIMDHQARIIEIESWDKYINYFINYKNKPLAEFRCITNLQGNILPKFLNPYDLKYDNYHLSCSLFDSDGMEIKKLSYLVSEY